MKWVTIWGNAQSIVLPEPAVYAKDLTLRYPIFIPFNGTRLRISLDNFCCDEDVCIAGMCVSVSKKFSSELGDELLYLTYQGQRSFILKAHQALSLDEISLPLTEESYLIVSIYLKDYTKLVSGVDIIGPLSKGYFAYGCQWDKKSLDIYTSKTISWVYFLANIDVYTEDDREAIVCFGDSITSQDWPDDLLLSLRERGIKNISVVRKAVSGTRVLREYNCITYQSYGKKGEARFLRELSSVSSVKTLIIQHGINDIIHPVGVEINPFRPLSDMPTAEELISGLKWYLKTACPLVENIYLGTLLPIKGWRTFSKEKEAIKNEVNTWIKSQKHIDFEKCIGEEINHIWQFKDGYDSGDHLHPSKLAYKEMGKFVAEHIFKEKRNED